MSKAQEHFIATKIEIDELLQQLQKHSDNHFNVNPDHIDWSHTGNLDYIRGRLQMALNFVENKE